MNANMKGIKNKILTWIKDFRALNCEAKIGVVFLIPPIIGVLFFVLNILGADLDFYSILESWNCIDNYEYYSSSSTSVVYSSTPSVPIYFGLMAIAGAYLIKGNLKKGE